MNTPGKKEINGHVLLNLSRYSARDRGFSHELAGWVSALHQKTLSSTLYAKTLLRNKLVFF
jgi:hypothetical protein